jgi:hypothetical protein
LPDASEGIGRSARVTSDVVVAEPGVWGDTREVVSPRLNKLRGT